MADVDRQEIIMALSKAHILLACSSLDVPSGYEKAVTETANLFAANGHRVTLLILDQTSRIYFLLSNAIEIIQEEMHFGITEKGNPLIRKYWLWRDRSRLKKIVLSCKPDIFIGTEYQFTAAAILGGLQKFMRVYTWEHHHFHWIRRNKFWMALSKMAYRKANGLICLNHQEAAIYRSFGRTTVIPNFTHQKQGKRAEEKLLLTVARLIHTKGIDLLLEVAKIILQRYPTWRWKIIGDGLMEDVVRSFITLNGLEGRLILKQPAGPNLDEEYRQTSLYIMTSRSEAFPLVLLEAMAWGIPCISFDCPSGPSEIIQHKHTGLLVAAENTREMEIAIQQLIDHPERCQEFSRNSLQKVSQYFPEQVYKKWEKLFNEEVVS